MDAISQYPPKIGTPKDHWDEARPSIPTKSFWQDSYTLSKFRQHMSPFRKRGTKKGNLKPTLSTNHNIGIVLHPISRSDARRLPIIPRNRSPHDNLNAFFSRLLLQDNMHISSMHLPKRIPHLLCFLVVILAVYLLGAVEGEETGSLVAGAIFFHFGTDAHVGGYLGYICAEEDACADLGGVLVGWWDGDGRWVRYNSFFR